MGETSTVGIRLTRYAALRIASSADDQISPDLLVPDQPVLIESEGITCLAFVAISARQMFISPSDGSGIRILAAGYDSPAIIELIGQRNASALRTARSLAGPNVEIRDAAWHFDQARLRFFCERAPDGDVGVLRDRLAAEFKTEIRFAWPGGEEPPRLG